jgi:hypothetical protein
VLGLGQQQQLVGDLDQRRLLACISRQISSMSARRLSRRCGVARAAHELDLRGLQRQRRAQLVRRVGDEAPLRLECALSSRTNWLMVSPTGRSSLCRLRASTAKSRCSGSRRASWRPRRITGRSSQVSASGVSTSARASAASRYSTVGHHSVRTIWSRLPVVLATAMVMACAPATSYMARSVRTARTGRPSIRASYHCARSGPAAGAAPAAESRAAGQRPAVSGGHAQEHLVVRGRGEQGQRRRRHAGLHGVAFPDQAVRQHLGRGQQVVVLHVVGHGGRVAPAEPGADGDEQRERQQQPGRQAKAQAGRHEDQTPSRMRSR